MHARSIADLRVRTRLTPLLVIALLVGGCAAGATPPPDPTASTTLTPSLSHPPSDSPSPTAAPEFPVTVTDDEGTSVTIEAAPDSIVSLTPAATETLFALGLGDRIRGKAEDFFLYPPEAAEIPDVAKFNEVDIEQVVGLEADLVIAGGAGFTPADSIDRLRELGIPVVVLYAADIATAYADIELIGAVSGMATEAQAMTRRMQDAMAEVAGAVTARTKPRVFYETGTDGATVYGVADQSFLAEMIGLAGGTPVTTGSPTAYEMPVERLISENPEVILLSDAAFGVTVDQVTERPGWEAISAVQTGDIRPIDDQTVTRPGPRLFLGLALLARTIHPDATIPEPEAIPPVP